VVLTNIVEEILWPDPPGRTTGTHVNCQQLQRSTNKIHCTKKLTSAAQQSEKCIQFTLQTKTVKDYIKHTFTYKPDEKNMMKWLTPFCIQLIDQAYPTRLLDEFKPTKKCIIDAIAYRNSSQSKANLTSLNWYRNHSSGPSTLDKFLPLTRTVRVLGF